MSSHKGPALPSMRSALLRTMDRQSSYATETDRKRARRTREDDVSTHRLPQAPPRGLSAQQQRAAAEILRQQEARPLALTVHDVLEHLQKLYSEYPNDEGRRRCTREQIESVVGPVGDTAWEMLHTHGKIEFKDEMLQYRAKFSVKNREGLIALINSLPNGVLESELVDCYKNVRADIETLINGKKPYIIRLCDNVTKQNVLFPSPPRFMMAVSDEFKAMWSDVRIPMDLDSVLKAVHLAPMHVIDVESEDLITAKKEGTLGKRKRRGGGKRGPRKFMNVHVDGLDLSKDYVPDDK